MYRSASTPPPLALPSSNPPRRDRRRGSGLAPIGSPEGLPADGRGRDWPPGPRVTQPFRTAERRAKGVAQPFRAVAMVWPLLLTLASACATVPPPAPPSITWEEKLSW